MPKHHDTSKLPDVVRGHIKRDDMTGYDKFVCEMERRPRTHMEATGEDRPQKPPKYPLYDLEVGEGFLWLPNQTPAARRSCRNNVWVCADNQGIKVKSKQFTPEDGYHYIFFWRSE